MKKKRILSVLLSLMLIINMFPSFALALNTDANGVYQISTAQELAEFRNMVNNGSTSIRAVLLKDIDLGGSEENQWTPIGNRSKQFTGSFDGGGYEITGLYINSTSDYQGLFGYVGKGGTVANLGISGEVTGSWYVGGVAGYNYSTIESCYNTGKVTGSWFVGGVAGWNDGGTIESCYNTGAVSGNQRIGGVAGQNNSTIESCYNTGEVTGSSGYVGGVAGYNDGTIENCYNTGEVTGNDSSINIGGVAGVNNGTIESCYNTGEVTGSNWYVGGVAGYNNNNGTIENCHYLEGTADGGINGSDAAGSAEVLTAAEFKDSAKFAGWDFDTVWEMSSFFNRPTLRSAPELKGSGTEVDPYQIPDLSTLEAFRDYVNAGNGSGEYFKQTNTIDLSSKYGKDINGKEVSWTPIGDYYGSDYGLTFNGNYDGGGFEITGLYINIIYFNYQGLFGYIGSGGVVANLGVSGTVSGNQYIGGVAGYNLGTITNCYSTVTVSGNYQVGGVAGLNYYGTIESCYNTGDVSGTVSGSNEVGGVAGLNYYGTIESCYNTGAVSGNQRIGGVAGRNYGTGSTIENCYNTGAVSGSSSGGGVVGYNYGGTIENCYYLENTANGGINGSDAEGSAEVLTAAELAKAANFDSWDFDTVWGMSPTLGRPVLKAIPESAYFKGKGTEEDPYQIPDLETLELLREFVNAGNGSGEYFKQTNTIDLSSKYGKDINGEEVSWTPIGDYAGSNYSLTFNGNYDGGGFEITGLYINSTSDYQGLFGYIGSGGTVANLGVSGEVTVTGDGYDVGGVAGVNAGTIENCYNTGDVTGDSQVGGVAGINYGTITNCYYLENTADGGINGSDAAGSAEVLTKAKFKVSANFTDWDFDTVWGMETLLGRPVLKSIPEKFDPQAAFNGEGTKDSPYQIPDLATLEYFRDYINAGYGSGEYFEQTATIDLSSVYSSTTGTSWTPIGNYSKPFTGNYNGGGFEITGLYINSRSGCQGLFGYIGSGGVVANLGVSGEVNGDGDYYVGGVAGDNDGTIENCYNTGAVSGSSSSVGGVTGLNWGTIENCYNTGAVSGSDYVGGVTGISMGTIKNSYNTGDVTGSGSSVGGVAGQSTYGTIKNSYNTGAVSSSSVSSGSRVGGVAGYSDNNNTIENCYYLENTADGGIDGSDAAGSAEVLTAEQFKDKTNFENWDFNTVWGMNLILGRPVLQVIPEAGYFKGEGTKDSPYLIPDLATLEYFRDYINAGYGSGEYFEQTATIDMSSKYGKDINGKEVSWTPIGDFSLYPSILPFYGNYDGGGFEITGLYINSTSNYQGLFGYIGSGGTVANLGVSGTVSGSQFIGGVAGYNSGTITNCYSTVTVSGDYQVGGVAGFNYYGTIESCYNTGDVSGSSSVGGVAGENYSATIENSYNTGKVTNSGNYTGGVAGKSTYGTIKNSYNTGDVIGGNQLVGGVAGYSGNNTIENCYNTGDVTGVYSVGGVAGNNAGTIENCYYLENTANGGINGKDTSGAAPKSAEAFAGGEVCWLLNGSTSIGELVWYQNIDNGETPDESPKFTGGIVYMNADGDYTNTPQIEFNSDVPAIISIISGEKAEIALSDYIANADAVGGVSFAAADLPEGLVLDSDSAAITGTCTAPGGNYTITLTVIAGNSNTDERQLELTLLVTSYTAIIPEQITADGTEVKIGAEDVMLPDNRQLTFSISESSVFTLKNEQNISLDYTVTKDSAEVSPGGTFLSLTQDGTCNLLFTADKPKYSGKYTGTVTFIISVEEVQSP